MPGLPLLRDFREPLAELVAALARCLSRQSPSRLEGGVEADGLDVVAMDRGEVFGGHAVTGSEFGRARRAGASAHGPGLLVAERPGDAERCTVVVPCGRRGPFGAEAVGIRAVNDARRISLPIPLTLVVDRPSHEPVSNCRSTGKLVANSSVEPTTVPSRMVAKGIRHAFDVASARARQWNCIALRSSCGEGASVQAMENGM